MEREWHPRVKLGGRGELTRLCPLMPHLIHIVSRRCPCKAAWLAQSGGECGGGQQATLKGLPAGCGVTRLWEAAALPSQWLGAAKSSWEHTPSFSLPPHCDPTSCVSVPSAFIASQGPGLLEPGWLVSSSRCCSDRP